MLGPRVAWAIHAIAAGDAPFAAPVFGSLTAPEATFGPARFRWLVVSLTGGCVTFTTPAGVLKHRIERPEVRVYSTSRPMHRLTLGRIDGDVYLELALESQPRIAPDTTAEQPSSA
jgi:hypothetical protein